MLRRVAAAIGALFIAGFVCAVAVGQPQAGEIAYVTASALNVRAGPGPEEPLVGRLARGAEVRVHERADGWVRVEALSAGPQGWVADRYLAGEWPAAPQLSDAAVRRRLMEESLSYYSGSCPCPYNYDRGGRRCGGRSAYSRPGGASPLCYASDVPQSMVDAYRARRP
jgi:uncharacterized protein YraI